MTNSNQANNQTHQDQKYFDLHVAGIGYLYRAREVQVKRGQPFLAVEVSALHGEADDVNYTRFDCRVSGKEAQEVIRLLMPEIQGKKRCWCPSSSVIFIPKPLCMTGITLKQVKLASASRRGY